GDVERHPRQRGDVPAPARLIRLARRLDAKHRARAHRHAAYSWQSGPEVSTEPRRVNRGASRLCRGAPSAGGLGGPLGAPHLGQAPHFGLGKVAVAFAYSFGATVSQCLSLTTNTSPLASAFSPFATNFAPLSCMYMRSPAFIWVAAMASRSFLRSALPARSSASHSTAQAVTPPAEVESTGSLTRSSYFLESSRSPLMSASPDQLVVAST